MRTFFATLGLLLAVAAGNPAAAYPLGAKAPLLSPGACANKLVNIDFTRGLYCANGQSRAQFTDLPNATFTRASAKTCQTLAGFVVSAASGVPCITDQGFLIEESRTNVVFPSTLTSAAGGSNQWNLNLSGTASTLTANNFAAPDGSLTAAKIVTNAANNGLYFRSTTVPAANAQWTEAVWVFVTTPTTFGVHVGDTPASTAWVAHGSASFAVPANQWTRISQTVTALATVTATSATFEVSVPGGASTFWLWNEQAEAGAFASSDIITTSAAGTRAADMATVPWSPAAQGTLYGAMGMNASPNSAGRLAGTNGTNADAPLAWQSVSLVQTWNGSVSLASNAISPSPAIGQSVKMAVAWDATGRALTAGGATPTSDSNAFHTDAITTLYIGSANGGSFENQYVQRLVILPLRASNAQLQALTQ